MIGLASALAFSGRAAETATSPFQQGLVEEEANRNLAAAIQAYQAAVDQFDEQRKVAGTAVFRLAECYRKLGKTNEAAVQYQRVVRDFADQTNLVTLSRKELDRMPQFRVRLQQVVNRAGPDATAAPDPQRDLLQQELKLVEQQLSSKQAQLRAGVANADDLFPIQREILSLKRQMAALDARAPVDLLPAPLTQDNAPVEPAAADEETQEIQRLKALQANSPDLLNSRDGQGMAPLHYVSIKGQLQVVRLLLEAGADREVRRKDGCTPLHLAVLGGHKAVAEFLLRQGANVGARNDKQATPLHIAAAKGFAALAELLLDQGAEANALSEGGNVEFAMGESRISIVAGMPLHSAAAVGSKATVKLLLDRKAEVDARSPVGNTPLMVAASSDQAEVAAALVDAGADVDAAGFRGATPLHWATASQSPEVMKVLLARKPSPDPAMGSGLTPLHLATIRDRKELVELLLKAGADPNRVMDLTAKEDRGQNLIDVPGTKAGMTRVEKGKPRAGAVFMEWSGSWTPLEYALANDQTDLVEVLLKGGANPNLAVRATPPIFSAVGSPDLLQLFLSSKADVNARDVLDLQTPLHAATARNYAAAVKLLLAHRADINATNRYGSTPLHSAAGNLAKEMVELLLAHGANPNLKDSYNRTPLDYLKPRSSGGTTSPVAIQMAYPPPPRLSGSTAISSDPSEIADLLRQHGAKE